MSNSVSNKSRRKLDLKIAASLYMDPSNYSRISTANNSNNTYFKTTVSSFHTLGPNLGGAGNAPLNGPFSGVHGKASRKRSMLVS